MAKTVTKRSGQTVGFNAKKIYAAIEGAAKETGEMNTNDIDQVTMAVIVDLSTIDNAQVETIQDDIEMQLMQHGFYKTAKAFVLYRQRHREQREASMHLMEQYQDLLFKDAGDMDLKRDNANINTDAPMGIMLKLGTEGAKTFADHYAIPEEYAKADKENWIHIHDKDFSMITFNCCQIDLGKLLKGGFSTGHGFLREPNGIRSAAALACIAIQSNQNDMFGGQSINAWDWCLAPYVDKSFVKAVKHAANEWLKFNGFEEYDMDFSDMKYGMPIKKAREIISNNLNPRYVHRVHDIDADRIYSVAMASVEEETKQAMEAAIHNFNSLHSRAGGQVPFSSINYGLCTSSAGRLVIKMTLEAIYDGLGHGETAIFPISVFQLKAGVNYNPGDPNYDLFKRACEVSAKRLFPNFENLDAPYNLQYYKPDDYNSFVATMG